MHATTVSLDFAMLVIDMVHRHSTWGGLLVDFSPLEAYMAHYDTIES